MFLLSLVNYIDEYLTANNAVPETSDTHTKIGGMLLISTIANIVGVVVIWLVVGSVALPLTPLIISILSAIPLVLMFGLYFYLLVTYPVYQVVPAFLFISVWLLIIELLFGGSVTLVGLLGIAVLIIGAYLLDVGAFKWQTPTKLLLISIPASLGWAVSLFMVRIAAENNSAMVVSFWQFLGISIIGIFLFLFIKKYRDGFLFRIRHQGKNFLGFSVLNESLAQGSFFFGNLAVAVAPVATYVTAVEGSQGLFLLLLFMIFPLNGKDVKINKIQIFSIFLIAFGIFLIEWFK